jgi:hypothetical protein
MISALRTFSATIASAVVSTGGLVATHETWAADASAPYAVIPHIAAKDGGYDYVSVDSTAQRLYMARNDGVMTIDLKTNRQPRPTAMAACI